MENQLDEEEKLRRAQTVMEVQLPMAQEAAAACVGKTLEVLTEGFDGESGLWYGRSYMDAPDIDTRVYWSAAGEHEPGDFVRVLITGSDLYDLVGEEA